MPDEKGQSEVQQPEKTETTAETQNGVQLETLPDDVETDDVKQKETEEQRKQDEALAKEKEELADRLRQVEAEKIKLEQRVRDNQEYISRTRNVEKEPIHPVKTFDDYLGDLEKIVDKDFENDPKHGLKSIVKKVVTDIAVDRDLERREMEKRIADAEEKAFRRVLALDPERNKIVQDVEKFDEEHPNLKALNFDQKLEILRISGTPAKKEPDKKLMERERDLAGDVGGGQSRARDDKIPNWANDPEVRKKALGHFDSVKELMAWSNSKSAVEMARKKFRPQSN